MLKCSNIRTGRHRAFDPARPVVSSPSADTGARPEARNALNAAVREGLYAGVRRFNEDGTAKVLVLTGAGEKAFCAGGDLKEMAETALTVPPPDFVPQFGEQRFHFLF